MFNKYHLKCKISSLYLFENDEGTFTSFINYYFNVTYYLEKIPNPPLNLFQKKECLQQLNHLISLLIHLIILL
jgi:hypothetical protein